MTLMSLQRHAVMEAILHPYLSFVRVIKRPVITSLRLPNIPPLELSRSQTIQSICVFISLKLQLAGILVNNHPKRTSLQNIPLFGKISRCDFTSPKTCTTRERWAKYLEFQVSRSCLDLIKTRFVTSGLFLKSEIVGYFILVFGMFMNLLKLWTSTSKLGLPTV